jgi:mycothiol synthase
MVGVVAEHTGHKLGKWVSLAVLIYFRDNGFKCSMLDTDDFRVPAVKTYLNLGFVPVYVEAGQPERWQKIFEKLGLPSMSTQIANVRETFPKDLWTKVSS